MKPRVRRKSKEVVTTPTGLKRYDKIISEKEKNQGVKYTSHSIYRKPTGERAISVSYKKPSGGTSTIEHGLVTTPGLKRTKRNPNYPGGVKKRRMHRGITKTKKGY